ncbi:hypothetical protein TELCIR_00331 [Teladorsagia circumcincta]|uniref:Autophagy-related protein 2 n=1 Tax=Teladorsagia circumcincta TaxID=45464 RepID=A0A2G9V511_TELCI|nr:hypothetical protein TELCIR_00331 [Teladorsagia circumcincta]
MIGSVVESLVSSSELARSFYENEKEAGEEEFDTEAKDGVKAFTKVIDAIVSRFCLELIDTTIRLENPPKLLSDMCTAIEVRIKEVRFMDEQMRNCQQEGRSAETITSQPQGMGSIANLNKFMDMSGVEIFTDIFTELEDQLSDNNSSQIVTSMYIRREKQKHKSPTLASHESISPELFTSALSSSTANFQSCYSNLNAGESLNQSIGEPFKITRVDTERELISSPVKFAEFIGESRLIFRIKNSDAIADKKDNRVEIESFFTGLHCFILPSQFDILKRFFNSVSLPQGEKLNDFGKKMDKSDYDAMAKNIEEEAFQKTRLTTLGMQGTWSRRDDFHEFDSVNLEDNRSMRKLSEACRENYNTISWKDPLQLRDDLFGVPLVVEQPSRLMVVLKCQAIDVNLRIPIADLRNPSGARLPYRQRHVHPEYIGLHINSVTVEMPIGGESTLLELFATEIYGSFCGVSEKFTCSDEDRRFLWGGQTSVDEPVQLIYFACSVKFEYDPRNKALKASSTKIHYLILAGSREEMTAFGARCILQSVLVISLDIPILRLLIPSHSYLEVLYNRLVNDLLLWQPAAPSVRPGDDEFKINALSDDMFHECGGDPVDRYEDDCEEERFTSSQANGYDKNKSHTLSLLLNVKKGTMLMCTGADEKADQNEMGQVAIELSDAQLFTVAGYHGRISDTYFYFTTHTIGVGHRNACTMPKVVNQADFGKWSRDDTQMDSISSSDEFSSQSTDDSVGVAIFLCERLGQNIKTDLHIHLDNVVLAYDHAWTKPESDIRLRLVLGESDISSSIIQDMNAAKVSSFFYFCKALLITAHDCILLQVILSSFFPVSENTHVSAPILEIRCRNDIIKAWVCVDSLVVLLNLASEISRSEKFATAEPKGVSTCPSMDSCDEPPKERSYSTPEYREGKGKNQVVSPDAVGGKYRDHSVCVVLELKKITCIFQQFNKDAPLMSMKLFTIHDITLYDRLTASQIKEMMYQYSSAEQPRRTCAPMLAVRVVESHKNEGKLRAISPDFNEGGSPDFIRAPSTEDDVLLADDLHLAGDWSSSSEIRFPDMDHMGPVSAVDKMLMGASMHDSFHPSMMLPDDDKVHDDFLVSDELIDTSGEIDACMNDGDRVAIDEWMTDIKSNLPNVLASCGPISPFVQIGKGVVDLFWLPVAELRKEDGHVVKGIQKGVGSFGLSSAAGVVGMAQTVVGVIQGYRQARDDLELAAQEDRASGQSSFRSVLKVAPKAIIGPFVAGTQIGYQVLGGAFLPRDFDFYMS